MYHSFLKKAGAALGLALLGLGTLPVTAQGLWAPYFGNTHFGFSTGSRANGFFPSAVKVADLDGDADLDAVVSQANFSSGFAVLLNQGAGYYSAPVQHPTDTASMNLVVGDFTGDGHADVVVANTGDYGDGRTVALFRGAGNGTFSADSVYRVGRGPVGLVAADLNADGQLDLAVANYGWGTDSTVSVLLNAGNGVFGAAMTLTVGAAPYQLAVGRLDSDALPDLVVAADDQRLYVLRNLGGGAFQDTTYRMQNSNWAGDIGPVVALADMDGDQDLDVLYSSNRTWDGNRGHILIRANQGDGVLDTVMTKVNFENYSTGTSSLAVADLNGDNLPDLVSSAASGRTGDGYRVILNQGNGQFGPPVVRPGGQRTAAVAVGDVTGDSRPDVFTIDDYSMIMTVHYNYGNGQFPSQTLYTAGVPTIAGTLEAGDLDNDGDLDIVTSSNRRAAVGVAVAVLMNTGGGVFGPGVQIATAGKQAKCRDLDNDGDLDLLYIGGTGTTGYNFLTALNQGNGTFGAPTLWTVGTCAPEDIDASDLDGDGDLDVVVSGGCSGGQVYVSPNLGNATFGPAVGVSTGAWAGALALGDFNEDGRLDVAAGVASEIAVLLGDSTGLQAPSSVTMDASPFDILAADLNDDGHLDLASCNYGSGLMGYSMAVRLGNGDGTFQPVQLLPAAYSPDLANVSGIACGDIDNDFDLDLMVSNNATNDMSIFLNQGNGQFSAALRAGLYYGARSPWFADFNNDGHCEVAALVDTPPSGFQSALVVLQGTNSGLRTAGTGPVVLGTREEEKARAVERLSAWPNPFSQETSLRFTLARAGQVTVTLHDVLGREVARPFSGVLSAGMQQVAVRKGQLAPGVYVARVSSGGGVRTMRVIKN